MAIFSDYQKAKSELGDKLSGQFRMIRRLNEENQWLKDEVEQLKKRELKADYCKHLAVQGTKDIETYYENELNKVKEELRIFKEEFRNTGKK